MDRKSQDRGRCKEPWIGFGPLLSCFVSLKHMYTKRAGAADLAGEGVWTYAVGTPSFLASWVASFWAWASSAFATGSCSALATHALA